MKEQTRNTEIQINEEEIGKLPEKELRIMIVKMIRKKKKNLGNRMEKMQESINKDLEELRRRKWQLQYSCLENPMDRGAWWAAVHNVAKSRTQLKILRSSSSRRIKE